MPACICCRRLQQSTNVSSTDVLVTTQLCYRCGKRKALGAFTRRKDGRVYEMCRVCVRAILQRAPGTSRQRLVHTATHRTCYLCTRRLTTKHFTRRTVGTYYSACKDCNKLVFAQRRRARLLAAEGSFTRAERRSHVRELTRADRLTHIYPLGQSQGTAVVVAKHQRILLRCKGKGVAYQLQFTPRAFRDLEGLPDRARRASPPYLGENGPQQNLYGWATTRFTLATEPQCHDFTYSRYWAGRSPG